MTLPPLYKAVQKLPTELNSLDYSSVVTTLANAMVDKYGWFLAEQLLSRAAKVALAQKD